MIGQEKWKRNDKVGICKEHVVNHLTVKIATDGAYTLVSMISTFELRRNQPCNFVAPSPKT
jgi:hypothetical protein